jgi:hypothetical protein
MRDEQVAAAGEQQAEPAGALIGVEEQPADLARSFKIGDEAEHVGAHRAVEFLRMLGQGAEAVGIERPALAHLAISWQVPRTAPVRAFSSTKTNSSSASVSSSLAQRRLGAFQLGASAAIGRQVGEAAAGQLGHFVKRLKIGGRARRGSRKVTAIAP